MSELLGIARFKFHESKREEYLRMSDQAMDIAARTLTLCGSSSHWWMRNTSAVSGEGVLWAVLA